MVASKLDRNLDRIGAYRIERESARTGMCVEYQGVHLVLPRRAVIKATAPTQSPAAVHVLREACLLEALHHPGVPRVFESGLLPDRRPWFAREVIEGVTVASSLAPGAIDRIAVIVLLRDVAEILAHAHHRGIVHGNLRPDRILMTGRSRGFPVCIADWSDARAHDASAALPVTAVASWYYTAPEVACGEALDDRADVFSLGVIAYRLLTGTLPFEGLAVGADGSAVHVPTELRCPEMPRELTALVDSMLAHARWDRPSSGEAHAELTWLADALKAPVEDRGVLRIRKPRWTPALDFAGPRGIAIGPLLLADDAPPRRR